MGTFSLTNSSQRIDQAVSAAHSGMFPDGSGVVFQSGNQTVEGEKTFSGKVFIRGGFDGSGNVSGVLSPHNNGLVNLGETGKRFGNVFSSGLNTITGFVSGNLVVGGTLTAANVDLSANSLNNITVTGTAAIQNARITGTLLVGGVSTISGAINSSGNNRFDGAQDFNGVTSFGATSFFENGLRSSGTTIFTNGFTSWGNNVLTGGSFTQSGTADMSGAFSHIGSFYNSGEFSQIGNFGLNGSLSLTGSFGLTGGSFTARAASFFTTGAALDRFQIVQPVDITGDVGITGSLKVSSNINATGNLTVQGNTNVNGTGYIKTIRASGGINSSGTNTLTGTNSIQGSNYLAGSTVASGQTTFANTTGQPVTFQSYYKPYIIASGLGAVNVTTLALASFWTTAGNATAPGTGIWITPYSGILGEVGLLLTGHASTVASNNNMPTGTYGKVIQFVNVGSRNGSGCWSPVGV